jgi:Fe-S-cluster containining protein
VSDLERQVERGSLFTHTALSTLAQRTYESESLVLGLVDVLIAEGLVEEGAVADAAEAVRTSLDARGETVGPGLALRMDPPGQEGAVAEVDCAARMHVCHAVCCKLSFALSAPEVEAGKVRWDLGQPYLIRHEEDGLCTHCDRATGACGVYADRPQTCKGYSCAGDKRIWNDFDKMELNHEWIDEHLVEPRPALATTAMVPAETLTRAAEPDGG